MVVNKEPSEFSEQVALCRRLHKSGVVFFAVPNGGRRDYVEAARLKQSGVKAGVPDLIILTPPPGYVGAVVELKRANAKPSDLRASQGDWLREFAGFGWLCVVGFGWRDAINQLKAGGLDL